MEIRNYNPETDYPELSALLKDEKTFGGVFDEARDAPERLATLPRCIFVAVEDKNIVGTISVLEDKRSAWLFRFAVKEENEVVAWALHNAAKEYIVFRGHTQYQVYAPAGDEKFVERYQKLGFTKGNDYTAFWQDV